MCLTGEMVENLKEVVKWLEPFEAVTKELSNEEYVSISKIVPLTTCRFLQRLTARYTSTKLKLGDDTNEQTLP